VKGDHMSEWQPIATAPKDGGMILIASDGQAAVMRWNLACQWWSLVVTGDGASSSRWEDMEWDERACWMPIPTGFEVKP